MDSKHYPDRPWDRIPASGRMLRPGEVADRIGLSRTQLYALVADGRLPPFLKIGTRASGMPEIWLDACLRKRGEEALESAGVADRAREMGT